MGSKPSWNLTLMPYLLSDYLGYKLNLNIMGPDFLLGLSFRYADIVAVHQSEPQAAATLCLSKDGQTETAGTRFYQG